DQLIDGVHPDRAVGRVERHGRNLLRLGRRRRLRLRLLLAEERREDPHHFTLEPGFTSPGSSMAVFSRSPPLAYRVLPCDARHLPSPRGGRFATTQTVFPTTSSAAYDWATPLTMVRGAASPRSTVSFSSLSFLGTFSAARILPARKSICAN